MVRSYLKGSASAAAVCLALGAAPAMAADLPVAVPVEPVVAPVLYTWTGFYYGGHIGAAWRDRDRDACSLVTEAFDTDEVFGFEESDEAEELPVDCETGTIGTTTDGPFEPGTRVDFIDLTRDGSELALAFERHHDDDDFDLLTGVQIGFNWQAGNLVFGVEADASMVHGENEEDITLAWYTNIENGNILTDNEGAGTLTIKDSIDWLATLRGRLGVAVGNEGRLLLYGTGGLALAGVDDDLSGIWHNATDSDSDMFLADDSDHDDDDIEVGFAVGGGIEYAVTNTISVGVEYLGMFFDEDDDNNGRSLTLVKGCCPDAAVVFEKDGLDDIHTVRGKVNFRFGGFAAAPAVAPAVTTRY